MIFSLLLPCAAFAQAPVSLHATYETYAAGLHVANVDSGFSLGPRTYQMNLAYQTTGMVGFFFRGHQVDSVSGSWRGPDAVPSRFVGEGLWRGNDRAAVIDYQRGRPVIRQLVPPNTDEREPVPEDLQVNSIDTLSALMQLIEAVQKTGKCETIVHTFDGRRATEIQAHTVGDEVLAPTRRSSFSGPALHCEFEGRMLAGFKFGDDRAHDSRPMHGSAWFAAVTPGGPKLPVKMAFETRWFGDATMYLTGVGPRADSQVASGD